MLSRATFVAPDYFVVFADNEHRIVGFYYKFLGDVREESADALEQIFLDFEKQISRYSCFMCFAILAAAAEGNHFNSLNKIIELFHCTIHKEEIKKAEFECLTVKSRIAIFLMKKEMYRLAFYFLNLVKKFKCLKRGGRSE